MLYVRVNYLFKLFLTMLLVYLFIYFFEERPLLATLGTLRYSGRGRGGRQPEVKCSILGTN